MQFVTLDTIKSYRSAYQGDGDRNDGVANQSGVGPEAAAARLLLR